MSICNFPESLSQRVLVGIILAARLGLQEPTWHRPDTANKTQKISAQGVYVKNRSMLHLKVCVLKVHSLSVN